MIKYVLDSSSLIRYIDNEAGSARLEEILTECVAGRADVCVSAVQWGEIAWKPAQAHWRIERESHPERASSKRSERSFL